MIARAGNERPHRLRVQGIATVDENDPLLAEFFEAQMIVRVLVTEIFRKVHQYKKLEASEYDQISRAAHAVAPGECMSFHRWQVPYQS